MHTKYVGAIIKQRRREKQISQESLAAYCKVSKQTISNIENGEAETSYIIFLRICKFIEIDPKDIMHLIEMLDMIHAETLPE